MSAQSDPAVPPPAARPASTRHRARPRVAGWFGLILGALYVALLWFAWWNESAARRDIAPGGSAPGLLEQWAVATHLLPAIVLLVVLILSWRWPAVGAIGFLGYAAVTVFQWYPEWISAPLVTVPPLVIGLLFLVDALMRRRRATPAPTASP